MRSLARRSRTLSRGKPRPAPRPAFRPAPANDGPLRWSADGACIRTAVGCGGRYFVISDGGANWSAQWHGYATTPKDGKTPRAPKPQLLFIRTSESHARSVCEAHHRDEVTAAFLEKHNAGDVVVRKLTGPAQAWK
jgi:hypothetical protein